TILGHMVTRQEGLEDLCQRVLGDDQGCTALTKSLQTIAASQAEAGDLEGAFAAAESIRDEVGRAWMLRALAASQAKGEEVLGTRKSYASACATAQAINEEWFRAG